MANVGSGDIGKTLIGTGNGASPTFVSLGTNSGLTAHGVVLAEGNNPFTVAIPGSSGNVLMSNGNTIDPTFQSIASAGAVTTITGNSGGAQSPIGGNFNVVGSGSITTVGTASTETIQLTGLTNHAVLVGAGTATITNVGPTSTAGQVLQSAGASADPAFSTATYPSTTTINQILYSSAANTIGGIAAGTNQVLIYNASSVPSAGTSLNNNFTYTSSTAGGARSVTCTNTDNTSGSSTAFYVSSTGGTSSGDCYYQTAVGSARSYSLGIDNSDTQSFKITTVANSTASPSIGNTTMRIDNSGNVALPLNACCGVDLNTGLTNATGDGTTVNPIIFDTDSVGFFDQNNNYNPSTGIFTANATGKYLVNAQITLSNIAAGHTSALLIVYLNGAAYTISEFNPAASADSSGYFTAKICSMLPMAATGTFTIGIQVSGSTKTVGIRGNFFGSYTNMNAVLIS